MFISIEGVDRTGKDTILSALDKKTGWQNCNMMRGPAGCLTYDKIYNRETKQRYDEALSVANTIKSTTHLIVYLYADIQTITKRLNDEIEEGGSGYFAPEPWSIKDVLELYEKNIDFLYTPEEVIKINTGKYNVDDCVSMIISKIEEIREKDMQLLIDTNSIHIKSPNKGEFNYVQYLPFSRVYTKSELLNKCFDITVDRPYYEMLEKSLEHLLYERELGWINDRQLVLTSNDCIPYIQLKITNECIEWFISQRSCDIKKHKLNDILFFKYFTYKKFVDKNFKIHYSCSFPHEYI